MNRIVRLALSDKLQRTGWPLLSVVLVAIVVPGNGQQRRGPDPESAETRIVRQ